MVCLWFACGLKSLRDSCKTLARRSQESRKNPARISDHKANHKQSPGAVILDPPIGIFAPNSKTELIHAQNGQICLGALRDSNIQVLKGLSRHLNREMPDLQFPFFSPRWPN